MRFLNAIATLCLSTLLAANVSFAAKPTDLVFLLKANSADKTKIYNDLVKKTVIAKDNKTGKTNTRNYHVTVGWIENGKTDAKLVKAMKMEFKSVGSLTYNVGQAGIYQVSPACPKPQPGNKKCTRNAIVLYPDLATQESLKSINSRLHAALENYNRANGTKFKMYNDIIPDNFTPHMTLADTKQVYAKNRANAVTQVNENIKNSRFTHVKLS